jgi:hypothetical protein
MDRLGKDGKYNVSGVATVAVAVLLTQILAGGPWVEVALIFGAAVVVGLGGGLLVLALGSRRERARWVRPEAEPVRTRRALPARATGEAA